MSHQRCGWIGADTAADGEATFLAHPDYFDAIHPKWFTLKEDGTPRALTMADDPEITQAARTHGVELIPLVYGESAAYLRKAFSSPGNIERHAQALADLAVERNYEGLELDYEHLWTAADRPGFTALIEAVAAAMHQRGKLVTLAVPALDLDHGRSGYDYAALSRSADVLHLMGYDFHFLGSSHLGPLAPLGWLRAVAVRVQDYQPQKWVLGLANYAVGSGWYTSAKDAAARCGGSYGRQTTHMASCPLGTHEAGLVPNCQTDRGTVFFEDAQSIGEKALMAKEMGLRGISYWTVGQEPEGFFDAVKAAFP